LNLPDCESFTHKHTKSPFNHHDKVLNGRHSTYIQLYFCNNICSIFLLFPR